ncbi:anti sigma factor C-terminal domain-containing protein [Psychrobacillus sp. NPDC096426]|uniref:anti-sigma factor n=1 Tax=Psychrobacillus sp. NPDC096426 TaxID=3364491 RepID=UPI00382DDD62
MMEWNEEKAQQIVGKYKKRFSWRFSLKVIRVVAAIIFLYFIYMMIISIAFNSGSGGKRVEFYQKLAIDWTYPEVSSGISMSQVHEITPFLTQKIEIPLTRRIGNEDYVVSELTLSKRLFSTLSHVEIEKNYPYSSSESKFYFNLPYYLNSDRKLKGSESPQVWSKLEKIHEGNVADLAFSTDEYYSPKEIIELISAYDLDITWMPLYMGENERFTGVGWGWGDDSMRIDSPWGLSGARVIDKQFGSGYLAKSLDSSSVEDSEKAMLDNMQMMLKDNKKLAEVLLNTQNLQERYDYLHDEGFQAYGAVVTGPVKELLKLKDIKEIRSVQLGEITYWNWEK